MALSATGRTLRIRRQVYSDSPGGSEGMMEDDEEVRPIAGSGIKLNRKGRTGKLAIRIQLDGSADNFSSGSVLTNLLPQELIEGDNDISSDDEIYKDVRTFVRQTMGKQAVLRAEGGICGTGEYAETGAASRAATQWLERGAGDYVTVRHPFPDAPIDVPPLPIVTASVTNASSMTGGVTHKLPLTCRHWFDIGYVADFERAELSTFGVSESLYRELRDRIINAYNTEPSKFLSVRNAREATGYAEISVLVKIWSFLDCWGVINYYADPSTAPRFSKKLIDFPIGRPEEEIVRVVCSVCCKTCTITSYILRPESAPLIPKEQISMARLCSTCFNTGSYPPFFSKDSFEQVDVTLPGTVTFEWTEEETMKLFEAIERYGSSDWAAIASMVGGGKTAAQCLLHFAQLPMNERFFPQHSQSSEKININPFRDSDNPVLTVINLMCSVVPKEVGSAVAALVVPPETRDVEMH